MAMARFLYLATQYVDPSGSRGQELDKWYWEEHLPAMSAVPGVLGGQRYQAAGTSFPEAPQYVTIFQLERPEIVEGDQWRVNADGSEWAARLSLHTRSVPGVYERIVPKDVDDAAPYPDGECLFVVRMTPKNASEDEFNRWYDEVHLPEITACPGVLSGRRFVRVGRQYPYAPKYLALYELESPVAVETTVWKKVAYDPKVFAVLSRVRHLKSSPGVFRRMERPR